MEFDWTGELFIELYDENVVLYDPADTSYMY